MSSATITFSNPKMATYVSKRSLNDGDEVEEGRNFWASLSKSGGILVPVPPTLPPTAADNAMASPSPCVT